MKRLFALFIFFINIVVYAQYYWGDVNHDGKVDSEDHKIITQIILGKINPEKIVIVKDNHLDDSYYWADANADGEVNISDMVTIAGSKEAKKINYTNIQNPKLNNNGHTYVDLGLVDEYNRPVYWATCNLGASTPTDNGNYYAWGETETKTSYSWNNYKYTSNSKIKVSSISRYNSTTSRFFNLLPEDDAAHVIWGGNWIIPTLTDIQQLKDKCTWVWQDKNNKEFKGNLGYKVIGPNGNHIFLPATGIFIDDKNIGKGNTCAIWSNEVYDRETFANLLFKSYDGQTLGIGDCVLTRSNGCVIRPVLKHEEFSPSSPFSGYTLSWHDEFDIDGPLNNRDWSMIHFLGGHDPNAQYEWQGLGASNKELQHYMSGVLPKTPKGQPIVYAEDGNMVLNLLLEDGEVYCATPFAHWFKGWQYGYFETRILVPKACGSWPAFWMMDADHKLHKMQLGAGWPRTGEIDIMEQYGKEPNRNHTSAHFDNGSSYPGETITGIYTRYTNYTNFTTEYHTFGFEWTPDYMKYYYDGKLAMRFDNQKVGTNMWPYDYPFYPRYNIAWGGGWGARAGSGGNFLGVDESTLPVAMLVDYIRIYQKTDQVAPIVPDEDPSDPSTDDPTGGDTPGGETPGEDNPTDQPQDEHEYVDLGLVNAAGKTVYWATCNLGASKETDFGYYYAWGESKNKTSFTTANYSNKNADAATVNWGGDWRTPTLEEMNLLVTKCTWTPVTTGVKGYKVTGPNGKSIFLPAAKMYDGSTQYVSNSKGQACYYWTATKVSNDSKAYYLSAYPSADATQKPASNNTSPYYYGRSIRPVFTK